MIGKFIFISNLNYTAECINYLKNGKISRRCRIKDGRIFMRNFNLILYLIKLINLYI